MNRLRPDADDARFIRRVLILFVIAAIVLALYRAADLLILGFGSVLGAIAIHAIAELLEQWRLPKRWALRAAMLAVLAILAFLVWLVGVQFRPQVNTLVIRLPGLLHQLEAWLSQSPVGAKIVDAVQAAFAGSRVAQDIGGLVRGSAELVLNMILLLIGALFLAADPGVYRRGVLLLLPRQHRPVYSDAFDDVGVQLRLWLRAELIGMSAMGILVSVGLWIAGVPSPAALGLLSGLSEFMPYIGPLAAMLPALGLAATQGTGPLIGALVTFAIVRLIQTNFITPYVQARVISIPPAITVFSIIGVGMVFGLFGLFFSASLLVVIFTLVRSLYLREMLGEDLKDASGPQDTGNS